MVSITSLRKNNKLNKLLGFRERNILFSKGVKLKIAKDFTPKGAFLEIFTKTNSFILTIKDNSNAKKFSIVG